MNEITQIIIVIIGGLILSWWMDKVMNTQNNHEKRIKKLESLKGD